MKKQSPMRPWRTEDGSITSPNKVDVDDSSLTRRQWTFTLSSLPHLNRSCPNDPSTKPCPDDRNDVWTAARRSSVQGQSSSMRTVANVAHDQVQRIPSR